MVEDESDQRPATRSIRRGAAAGAVGGFAGAAVKLLCEGIAPPRTPDREPPPGVLVAQLLRALTGRDLSTQRKETVSLVIHWVFSTVTGALYGASIARFPQARFGNGICFGTAVWIGFHELFLPLSGATPPLRELPVKEQLNELLSHAIFGVTVESVRATIVRFA